MHKEILTKEQVELLPLLKSSSKDFGLVGGTAIALHIGHRESIDFDLFSFKEFKNADIKKKVLRQSEIEKTIVSKKGEYTFFANKVKITYYNFPYELEYEESFEKIIRVPNLLTLAAMKAFALGQRAKWKDYVDLYFILKDFYSFEQISKKGRELFKNEFNEKLFRTQLIYFEDINYGEEVVFLPGFEVSEKVVKRELIKYSIA
jgi:hypothetical protein